MEPELYESPVGTVQASNGAILPCDQLAFFVLEFVNHAGYIESRVFRTRQAAARWEQDRGPDHILGRERPRHNGPEYRSGLAISTGDYPI